MHPSAILNCKDFFEVYAPAFTASDKVKIVEIGSQDVNGSLREVVPQHYDYTGLDFAEGKNVDIVLKDPYKLPLEDASVDIVLSSSCFEHSEMFWLTFMEIMRILKPKGLFYLNVPSNGDFHRYPVDCWRFYPDSGNALVTWAKHNGTNAVLLESFTSSQISDGWNDFIAVILKEASLFTDFPKRILETKSDFTNGIITGQGTFLKPSKISEDQKKLKAISQIVSNQVKIG